LKHRRVVITGMGTLSSLGLDLNQFWESALEGNTSIAPIPDRWQHFNKFRSQIWSPLPNIDYQSKGIPKIDLLRTDPVTLNFALTAEEALRHAGYDIQKNDSGHGYTIEGIDNTRTGVYVGTAVGGVNSSFKNHSNMLLHRLHPKISELISEEEAKALGMDLWIHPKKLNGFTVPMLMPNAISAYFAIRYGLSGPNQTVTLACAAGGAALGQAYRAIKSDIVDLAISGGSEYLGDEYGASFKGFDAAGTLTTLNDDPAQANRPFDKNRVGFLFAEGGSGTLVLEEYEKAKARGANILAEISGYGESFDAYNMLRPANDGKLAAQAIDSAIKDAGLSTEDIGYVNTHGTGTPTNDEIEAKMIAEMFTHKPHVNATKSLIGHTIGASGAIEAIVTAMSLKQQRTHGCLNLNDPVVDLNFCFNSQDIEARHAITHSFAFGGHNIALTLSAID